MITQICKNCKIEKPLTNDYFRPEKRVKTGYEVTCKSCQKIKAKQRRIINHSKCLQKEADLRKTHKYQTYHKQYYELNKEKIKLRSLSNYYKNPLPALNRSKQQKVRLGDIYKNYLKEYRKKNKTDLNKKFLKRLKTDIMFRMRHQLRSRLLKLLKSTPKQNSMINYIGCTFEFLKEYIEKQFVNGMTWENRGTYWELDHIIPCRAFDFRVDEQVKKCFHYSNLKPILKTENRQKSDFLPDGRRARNIKFSNENIIK